MPPPSNARSRRAVTAYVALGANLGDRRANLEAALGLLAELPRLRLLRVSAFFDTAHVGKTDQPRFLNAVARVETGLPPRRLLRALQIIEDRLGRRRDEHWGPRTLDLDLLLYGDRVVNEPDLVVPHPRMHERAFVLEPLVQIAPDARHPLLKTTAAELLHRLQRR